MEQSTANDRERDAFLTHPDTAKRFVVEFVLPLAEGRTLFVEPSAGKGAFIDALPDGSDFIATDIHPQDSRIERQDFMEWTPETAGFDTVITFGNPPFGKNSSLALKFINKAAEFSDFIAMILPRTFRKESMSRRIHPGLMGLIDVNVPKDSFIFENRTKDVPCCFMVFKKSSGQKTSSPPKPTTSRHFSFTEKETGAVSFQRVGARAGTVREEFRDRATTSHYFLQPIPPMTKERLIAVLASIDWDGVRHSTAGCPSISKRELVFRFDAAQKGKTHD